MKTLILTCLICSISGHLFGVYNPSAGRFLSRDPIEERGGLNLYSFVSNDPINSIDLYGLKRVTIWASAFIAPESIVFFDPYLFNLIRWSGDNRTFGPNQSARVWHEITIETDPDIQMNPIISNGSGAGKTTAIYFDLAGNKHVETATATKPGIAKAVRDPSNPCLVRVNISASSSNPLILGSPPIDYSYQLTFNEATGKVLYIGSHDKFPWHELYINRTPLVTDPPSGLTESPIDLFEIMGRKVIQSKSVDF